MRLKILIDLLVSVENKAGNIEVLYDYNNKIDYVKIVELQNKKILTLQKKKECLYE